MSDQLKGKSVVVTGSTSGIGFQAALEFAREGALVIGTGRDPSRCSAALERIQEQVPNARVSSLTADFSSQDQVRQLAQDIKGTLQENGRTALDVLVNNAGAYCGRKVITGDGVERTFAVNHLAPFLLTHLLLPLLAASPSGRVITVSSDSHYHARIVPEKVSNPWFYFGLRAYGQSKLANVLFTAEFNRRNKTSIPHAFAVDPGLVNTDIGLKETGALAGLVWKSRQRKGTKPEVPVRTILYLAGEPSLQDSGEIYWKDSLPKTPNRSAFDPDLARRLWDVSCRLCHINDYFTELAR